MLGFLIVDKPYGITSHDIIYRLRKRFNIRKIGHAGTLDPMATGVVIVGVGQATRFLNFLPSEPKVYEGKALLGTTTDTYDKEGQIILQREVPSYYKEKISEIKSSFIGTILQKPPIYSALKKDGKPLYSYARKGIEVEISPREVCIYSLGIVSDEENIIDFKVTCSGGTYIRSLIHDIGEALGCGAHLTELKRTAVGRFTLQNALSIESVLTTDILPLEKVLIDYKRRVLTENEVLKVQQGQKIKGFDKDETQLLVNNQGKIIALSKLQDEFLWPFCVISGLS